MNIEINRTVAVLFIFLISIATAFSQANSIEADSLTAKQQGMVHIAATTAKGTDTLQIKKAIGAGLTSGLSINEIREQMVHLYAYCGFPRSLNGINMLISVTNERKAKGIMDAVGKEASPVTSADKYQTGKETLETLTGKPETGPKTGANAFAPILDTFLKEHLFADVFSRDILTYAERELTTISALASMEGVPSQLQSHLAIGLNIGFSPTQLQQVFSLVQLDTSKKLADIARAMLVKASTPSTKK